MKKIILFVSMLICLCFYSADSNAQLAKKNLNPNFNLQIDGAKRLHQIDGIGVNANTRSWNGKELEPALDLLLDSMNSVIWRVIVETVENWEDKNDNNDPFTFNWDYYNKLYETPKFQKAWDMISYLNKHGVTNNLMINFMGAVPLWMGGKVVKPEYEDEYIEMLVSFFFYARNEKHLKIGLISIMNEPDIENEGPTVQPAQYARLLRKFTDRMERLGMGDVRYAAPDIAAMGDHVKYLPPVMKDSSLMSKISHFAFHSYAGYYSDVNTYLQKSAYPKSKFWITEWNQWCKGCDEGQIGVYDFKYASESIAHLLDLLKHGASGALVWEAFDSYYEHHAPSEFSYWGILNYNSETKNYSPRKNFYAISQISKFVSPGSFLLQTSAVGDSLPVLVFYDPVLQRISIVGINLRNIDVTLNGTLANLPGINRFEMYYTNSTENLYHDEAVTVKKNAFKTTIPANSIFTLTTNTVESSKPAAGPIKPEAPGWYAGDIHVHLNCGDGTTVLPESKIVEMMEPHDLSVISLLADMGNGEVKDSKTDLPKVNGKDAPQSVPGRIIRWDAEWHWDATYSNFEHQALGGHLVLLGLKKASRIWDESPYKILQWAKDQKAVRGFAHFQYLNDSLQNELNCCIPIDYPVEAALGNIDFISEDVYSSMSSNNGNYNSEAAINAYYKLLNCGFRPGLAAGTDYPCNNYEPFGTLLTYVEVPDKKLTYQKWINGIANGRTVVSRNGHNEFLEIKVNGKYQPGDEINLKQKGTTEIEVKWTAVKELTGRIELISEGKVVASQPGTAKPGEPLIFKTNQEFTKSSWVCARRMDENGHQTHTAPVYITINKKPVRASSDDAQFYMTWIDNLLEKTAPGGVWNHYFTHDLDTVQQRYRKARDIYSKILLESKTIN